MERLKNSFFVFLSITLILGIPLRPARAEAALPAGLAAALVLKVASFDTNLSSLGQVTAYVVGSSELQGELSKLIGQKIGTGTLSSVEGGGSIPSAPVSMIIVGEGVSVSDVVSYAKSNKAFAIGVTSEAVKDGLPVGVVLIDNGKPGILLNVEASSAIGVQWNPAIMKVAKTVK